MAKHWWQKQEIEVTRSGLTQPQTERIVKALNERFPDADVIVAESLNDKYSSTGTSGGISIDTVNWIVDRARRPR